MKDCFYEALLPTTSTTHDGDLIISAADLKNYFGMMDSLAYTEVMVQRMRRFKTSMMEVTELSYNSNFKKLVSHLIIY